MKSFHIVLETHVLSGVILAMKWLVMLEEPVRMMELGKEKKLIVL